MSFDPRHIRERKLVEWTLAYAGGAWLVLEVVGLAADAFDGPALVLQVAFGVVALGLPIALVLAWYHGEQGRQRVSGPELVIIAALLGVGGLLVANLTGGEGAGLGPLAFDDDLPSVAVLPLETLGGTEADAAFADGMHDELLHRLSKIGGIRVTSRTSVLGIREEFRRSRDIAQALGVGHLVEGTAQTAGDQVRIIVQLIEPETDDHLWSAEFTRTLTVENLFEIQSEISASIAAALAAELTPEERVQIADQPTQSLEAYLAFQRGNEAFANRRSLPNRLEAAAAYREATELDPRYVDAYARLARVLVLDFWYGQYDRVTEVYEALASAEALDSARAEVHLARGDVLYYTLRDYDAARRHYERVLVLQPSDATTMAQIGLMSLREGRDEDGTAYLARSLELDPRSAFYAAQMAFNERGFRRGAGMRRWAERALGLDPTNDAYRGQVVLAELCVRGDTVAARDFIEETEWATSSAEADARANLAMSRGELGRAGEFWMDVAVPVRSRAFYLHAAGDDAALKALSDSVLSELPDTLETAARLEEPYRQQGPGFVWSERGLFEAFRGNAEAGVRWALAGADVLSFEADPNEHAWRREDLLNTYILIGDYEAAFAEVEFLMSTWSYLGPGCLRLDPFYAPLRADPRLVELLASVGSG